MDHHLLDNAVKERFVVIMLKTQLDEVAACQGRLLAPQFDIHVSSGGVQDHLSVGVGFHVIHVRHPLRFVRNWECHFAVLTVLNEKA